MTHRTDNLEASRDELYDTYLRYFIIAHIGGGPQSPDPVAAPANDKGAYAAYRSEVLGAIALAVRDARSTSSSVPASQSDLLERLNALFDEDQS